MELFILLVGLAIFAETSILLFKKEKINLGGKRRIYIDTSALIDGRILDIAKSGFIDGNLIILKSVLRELQLLADGKDSEKRNRARAGLEVAAELERVLEVDTEVLDDGEGRKQVDEELLKHAKEGKGYILTLDYNLIKVATAENVKTLNINDLALALRNEFLPGEIIKLKILEKGTNRGQGVGHLNNGTMVIVDNAASKIGQEVTVEFVRFFETSAGRMIFARLVKQKQKNA
ncbi:TRAM domain-containing protein [Candidatus Saccharibacteria bacterium]|nr:TRAM domain-containing protein [Candidatus Saccharibacteria bacterium]